jgi:hypothetical protein
MTPEDQELTNWLCKEIQEEQDPKRFSELVWQLDSPALDSRLAGLAMRQSVWLSMLLLPLLLAPGFGQAKVIEFYVPTTFRRPRKGAALGLGKVIEFCTQTRKSA